MPTWSSSAAVCGALVLVSAGGCSIVESKYYEQLRAAAPDAALPMLADAQLAGPTLDAQLSEVEDAGRLAPGPTGQGDAGLNPLLPYLVDQCPTHGAGYVLSTSQTFLVDTRHLHN